MINKAFTTLLMLISITANAQLAKSIWFNSDEGSKVFLKFENELLTYGVSGVEDAFVHFGYAINGDTLFLRSFSNDQLCIGLDKKEATYLIGNLNKGILALTMISDKCDERSALLSGKDWNKAPTMTNEKLSYLVISIVKDEIIVDGIRNPQKLYITDLDGNPLLSVEGENKIALSTLAKGEYILEVWDQNQLTWAKQFDRD